MTTLDGRPPSSDDIYDDLLRDIISSKMLPGHLISENQLAKGYGVSRSVVHKAVLRLEQLQFLQVFPQRGIYVSKIDFRLSSGLLMIRQHMEQESLKNIIIQCSDEARNCLLSCLRHNLSKQIAYEEAGQPKIKLSRLDVKFHKAIIYAAGYQSLYDLILPTMAHSERWKNYILSYETASSSVLEQHQALISAIERCNLEEALEIMEMHLNTGNAFFTQACARHPEFFTNY